MFWEGIAQQDAAKKAARAQIEAAEKGIAEERRQFDIGKELTSPYVNQGQSALYEQMRMLGLGPSEDAMMARQAELNDPMIEKRLISGQLTDEFGNKMGYGDFNAYKQRITSYQPGQASPTAAMAMDPTFLALSQQGENAILQNASATGGLRGGNAQAALAQFRPQLLQMLLEQRFNQLGGLSGMGQVSAVGQAAAGQQMAGSISNLFGQQGQAAAGRDLATAQGWINAVSPAANIGNILNGVGGVKALAGAAV